MTYIRRSPDLMLDWAPDAMTVYDCKRLMRFQISSSIAALLAELQAWTPEQKARDAMDQAMIDRLAEHGLIQRKASLDESDGPRSTTWERWGNAATYFHSVASAATYITSGFEREELVAELTAEDSPAFFKDNLKYEEVVTLPEPSNVDCSLTDALTTRRTCREFDDNGVPLEALATILHYSFRPLLYIDAGAFGRVPLRASPCAGGRNEIEAYVFALNVVGLPSGLYHYAARDHTLGLLDGDTDREQLLAATFDQPALQTPPVVIATSAVLERVSYKYRHARAYRLLGYDAGHTGQTFALTCTALGFGPYQSAAFNDAKLAELLGLDYPEEIPTYLLACGIPKQRRDLMLESPFS